MIYQFIYLMHTFLIDLIFLKLCCTCSEDDEDDVSSSSSSHSIPPAVPPGRPKVESARVGVPVLPMSEVPLRPPRHSTSQTFFGGGVSGGGPVNISRGPLPPVPHQAQASQPTAQPRPPSGRSRPKSTSGISCNRIDSGQLTQFGPGKQEKEVITFSTQFIKFNIRPFYLRVIFEIEGFVSPMKNNTNL